MTHGLQREKTWLKFSPTLHIAVPLLSCAAEIRHDICYRVGGNG